MNESSCPRSRDIDRHEAEIRQIRADYLTEKLFLSMHNAFGERILRLEQADTSKAAGNRTWLLNLLGTILGVIVAGVITVLIARGGGH